MPGRENARAGHQAGPRHTAAPVVAVISSSYWKAVISRVTMARDGSLMVPVMTPGSQL